MSGYSPHEKFADETDDYLDKHNVYDMFSKLLKQLAISKPSDPYSFLINALEQPMDTKKLIVTAQPGAGKSTQTAKIVATYNLVHLKVDMLLRDEVSQKSDIGEKVKSYQDSQLPVPDDIVTTIIKARLSKDDCTTKGWLLDGYPTTSSQARALQNQGIICDKFIVLACSDETAKKRADESGTYTDLKEQFDTLTRSFKRNIKTIVPIYGKFVSFIDSEPSAPEVWSSLKLELERKPASKAPRRPMRIVMLGPVGAGKRTQCSRLARKYGLVHLTVGSILRDEMAKSPVLQEQLEGYMSGGSLVPDNVVIPKVIERVLQSDCRKKGWMLDGFPRTLAQAQALAKEGLTPNRCIYIDVPQSESIARVVARKVDPQTGLVYTGFMSNVPAKIKERLEQHPQDDSTCVKTKIMDFTANKDDVLEMYKDVSLKLDGCEDVDVLEAKIENFVLASLGAFKA